jgi:hypothetical protein
MTRRFLSLPGLLLAVAACAPKPVGEQVLFSEPLDDTQKVLSMDHVSIDRQISSDGIASLRVETEEPLRLQLVEVPLEDLDNTVLQYRAKLRSQNFDGVAYLEMWCRVKGKGEFFSRALHDPLRGDRNWISQQTPFLLQRGEHADLVRLNLVVDGRGSVWVDQLELLQSDELGPGPAR